MSKAAGLARATRRRGTDARMAPGSAWGPPPQTWPLWQPSEVKRRIASGLLAIIGAIVAVIVLMTGLGSLTDLDAAPAKSNSVDQPNPRAANGHGAALAALNSLAVKGRAPKTGYTRAQFGQSWRDLDRNGCDQRNDVLRRDLREFTLKAGTHGCLVLSGTLTSPYSGDVIHFVRGQRTSYEVQIDHVVALSDAWQKGAQQWSTAKRESFANDFLELRATDGHTNGSKSDSDAASWLPPRRAYWCGFVARQIAVKKKYGLWVTRAEHDSMDRILQTCPEQGLPRAYPIKLGGGPEQTAE